MNNKIKCIYGGINYSYDESILLYYTEYDRNRLDLTFQNNLMKIKKILNNKTN